MLVKFEIVSRAFYLSFMHIAISYEHFHAVKQFFFFGLRFWKQCANRLYNEC